MWRMFRDKDTILYMLDICGREQRTAQHIIYAF